MNQNTKFGIWASLLMEASPIVDENIARVLYHRVATAWGSGQTLHIVLYVRMNLMRSFIASRDFSNPSTPNVFVESTKLKWPSFL